MPTQELNLYDTELLEAEEVGIDINRWNGLRNNYELKKFSKRPKLPVSLLPAVLRDFNEWAVTYHMDASQFKFIRVTRQDPTWQVDFHCDRDPTGPHVSVYEIYYNTARRRIMQRCISTG